MEFGNQSKLVNSNTAEMWKYFSIVFVYFIVFVLHYLLPGRIVEGYCCGGNPIQPLKYKLNGIFVYFVVVISFFFLPRYIQVSFYENFSLNAFIANVLGLLVSTYFFIKGGEEKYSRCVTVDQLSETGKKTLKLAGPSPSNFTKFFFGNEWNPRIFNIDIKMFLYLVGAIQLQINICYDDVVRQHFHHGNDWLRQNRRLGSGDSEESLIRQSGDWHARIHGSRNVRGALRRRCRRLRLWHVHAGDGDF